MELPKELSVNGASYTVKKLLGKGKGGYSYLVTDGAGEYVLKQIHHEPCEYYQFGDKLAAELGPDPFRPSRFPKTTARILPLGTLFHIAPGNMSGLPVYTALEGLLTGNINLVKLPHGDKGLSLAAFQLLTEQEPRLSPYLYAFDLPSGQREDMEALAALADGLVVWGGDGAIEAARKLGGGRGLLPGLPALSGAGGGKASRPIGRGLRLPQRPHRPAGAHRGRDGGGGSAVPGPGLFRPSPARSGAGAVPHGGERAGEAAAPRGASARPAPPEGAAPDGGPPVSSRTAGGADGAAGPGGRDPRHTGRVHVRLLPRRGPRRGISPAPLRPGGGCGTLNRKNP